VPADERPADMIADFHEQPPFGPRISGTGEIRCDFGLCQFARASFRDQPAGAVPFCWGVKTGAAQKLPPTDNPTPGP